MRGRRRKETQIEKEYRRIRRNILRRIRRWGKAGYKIDVEVPKIPKKITEGSIRYLEKKAGKRAVQENSVFISEDTGEMIPGVRTDKIRSEIRRIREENLAEDLTGDGADGDIIPIIDDEAGRVIVNNLLNEFIKLNQPKAYMIFENWLRGWVAMMGFAYVGETLERAARSGIVVTVTEEDSEPKAVGKTKNYIYETMKLSGEYSHEYIVDMMSELDPGI